jgi:hypothetical protein
MRWALPVAGAVAVAAAAAYAYLDRLYRPLAAGSVSTAQTPPYADGAQFTYNLSIRNEGRLPVRLVDVPLGDPELDGLIVPTGVRLRDEIGNERPFRPLTLDHGEEAWVRVRARFDHCERFVPGSSYTIVGHRVRYRVARIVETVEHVTVENVSATSPAAGRCPSRD